MDNQLYDYSAIVDRPRLTLPGGARVAFWIGLNIEHYEVDKPSTSIFAGTAALQPDPLNYGWRDYGPRVGIWRMIDALDKYDLPASVLLTEVVRTIEQGTGSRPKGWLGPALTETFNTPELLAELGLTYVLDWCSDDQPFPLNVQAGRMISVPYSIEMNDVSLVVGKSLSGADFAQMVMDQFDVLYAEGAHSARVMCLALHPFIVNQPFRHKYLERALEYIVGHTGVWRATSDDIAEWYLTHAYDAARPRAAPGLAGGT